MQKEFDFLLLKEVRLVGSRADIKRMLLHVPAIREGYEARLRDDLALRESGFAMVLEQIDSANRPAYFCLARCLEHSREAIFENGGRAALSSPDLNHRAFGAIMLNLNIGFRTVLSPLILADTSFFQIAEASNQEKADLESQARMLA